MPTKNKWTHKKAAMISILENIFIAINVLSFCIDRRVVYGLVS